MKTNKNAKVSLVGAGPGDLELITVKGLKVIQSADVILYDALSNEDLLQEAPKEAVKIFVGKRAGKHSLKQEEINLLIVQSAYRYGHVVRLKGGDPFVFGRGHEELLYLQSFNIPVELIPGISSAISLPMLQAVPLTRRGVSESFWVLTGTTKSKQLSKDIQLAMQSSATLVVLMAIKKLKLIQSLFVDAGKSQTPVMVIQNGSRSNENVAIGTMKEIVALAESKNIGTPGIIVIGEAVALHPNLISTKVLAKWKI
jgi:uroporphyrin-III C-methyltransferase